MLPTRTQFPSRRTLNMETYSAYLKGAISGTSAPLPDSTRRSRIYNQAITKDPAYAEAYAGLADCYLRLGEFGSLPIADAYFKARSAAAKALELDENLAQPHAALASMDANEGHPQDAERQFSQV